MDRQTTPTNEMMTAVAKCVEIGNKFLISDMAIVYCPRKIKLLYDVDATS